MINKELTISPVGYIKTPYKDKFAVPRQPGLVPAALGEICFYPPYNDELAFEGIEGFSHLHVLFLFDKVSYSEFRPKVRPPRLGGNVSVGVFATRSPFRPNRIGLSIVRLNRVIRESGKVRLEVLGADLVDNTPILDIKPYIPFVDSIADAKGGFAAEKPKIYPVVFENDCDRILKESGDMVYKSVIQALALDPRPAYKEDDDPKVYFANLYDFEIRFRFSHETITVTGVNKVEL
ncbi:MAG: tRNA (N6-threonylcarbamoyladenosine(37)-N6)-methyltransferase TrmO [Succinivibrio sp.]